MEHGRLTGTEAGVDAVEHEGMVVDIEPQGRVRVRTRSPSFGSAFLCGSGEAHDRFFAEFPTAKPD
jgi:hypothetical protein